MMEKNVETLRLHKFSEYITEIYILRVFVALKEKSLHTSDE